MTQPGAPLLALHEVGVRLGDVQALQGVNLVLHAGERVALVGANGCGKTTLLRVMNGQLAPSSGQRQAAAPMVSTMLFQRPFFLRLSVANNLRLALWLGGVPAAEREGRLREALARVGLQGQARQPARTLSGGQQQRLALARAWARQASLLLLDEPTASLDPSAKREVEALIDGFAGGGMTVLLCTHNLGQAKRLARRVIYLEAGRLRVDLPTAEFFQPQASHAAQAFLRGELPWQP